MRWVGARWHWRAVCAVWDPTTQTSNSLTTELIPPANRMYSISIVFRDNQRHPPWSWTPSSGPSISSILQQNSCHMGVPLTFVNWSTSSKKNKGLCCWQSLNLWFLFECFFFFSDRDWEVCLHTLRLLQSVLVEQEVEGHLLLAPSLLDPDLCARVSQLTSMAQPSLRLAAQQTLEDLQDLQQVTWPHFMLKIEIELKMLTFMRSENK